MDNITPQPKKPHIYTNGEEWANTLTHFIAAICVLIFIPIMVVILRNNFVSLREQIGIVIFLLSIFSMLLMSSYYHSIEQNTPKKFVGRKLDHIFIFVAIAGSYTPITLSFVWKIPQYGIALAIALISVQWLIVIFGALYKSRLKGKKLTTSLPLYFAMGCIMVVLIPLIKSHGMTELFWFLIAGGLFYGLGVILFAFQRIRYTHTLWHFFVIFGSLAHIIGICFYLSF